MLFFYFIFGIIFSVEEKGVSFFYFIIDYVVVLMGLLVEEVKIFQKIWRLKFGKLPYPTTIVSKVPFEAQLT